MKCNCRFCRLGKRLQKIATNLPEKDRRFLLNDIFGTIENQALEIQTLKEKVGKPIKG